MIIKITSINYLLVALSLTISINGCKMESNKNELPVDLAKENSYTLYQPQKQIDTLLLVNEIKLRYQNFHASKDLFQTYGSTRSETQNPDPEEDGADYPDVWVYDSIFVSEGEIKMVLTYREETLWSTLTDRTEYYFENDTLYFIYHSSTETSDIPGSGLCMDNYPDCNASAHQSRKYFWNTKCIRHLTKSAEGTTSTIDSLIKTEPNSFNLNNDTSDYSYQNALTEKERVKKLIGI